MKKISYTHLQKKYPLQVVALNHNETRVLAAGKRFSAILKELKRISVDPKNCIYIGPIQRYGTINIYLSLQSKKYR